MLTTVGIVGCSQESSQQVTVPSPPPPPKQEVQKPETPPTSLESLNPPPGMDPITGKPKVTSNPQEPKPQEPSAEYGTRPAEADFETWKAKDYPYLATLPSGAEGKIQVAYNYLVERPLGSRYIVNIKITNLSNRPLQSFYYNEFLKDGEGNISNEVRNEGHHNAPPRFPLQPGDSVVLETSKVSLFESFGSTPIETWRVEIDVTYLKFE
jgi:hypothetical protein